MHNLKKHQYTLWYDLYEYTPYEINVVKCSATKCLLHVFLYI